MLRAIMIIIPVIPAILAYAAAWVIGICVSDARYYCLVPINTVTAVIGLIMFSHLFRKNV